MQNPRVTVVMPVYNGANYLREAIDSVLSQVYRNVEVLVVNDGSNDGGATDAIARSYGDKINYIAKANGGVASALNAGIAAMTGDIFCWLSHDDIFLPNKIERQVAHWTDLGCPDAVLISDYRLVDGDRRPIHDQRFDHQMLQEKPIYALLRGCIHGCTVFLPRRLFEKVGVFDESLPTTQDYDLWHRVIWHFPFIHMPEILIESRWHDDQGSKKPGHREEARILWRRMIHSVPADQQVVLEGSPARFLQEASRFLYRCGLVEVASDLSADAGAVRDGILISVVVWAAQPSYKLVSTIAAVAEQTHSAVELIVLAPPGWTDVAAILPLHARLIDPATPDMDWQLANGRYLAYLGDGELPLPEKLTRQLAAMDGERAVISYTGQWIYDGLPASLLHVPGAEPPHGPNTVMVARSALEADHAAYPEPAEIAARLARIASSAGVLAISEALSISRRSVR